MIEPKAGVRYSRFAPMFLLFFLCLGFLGLSASGTVYAQSASQDTIENSEASSGSEGGVKAKYFAGIPAIPAVKLTTNPDGTQDYTVTIQILALMTALTFIPSFLIMMTAFTRIIIVFAILRQAIGLQQTPSNQILMGIAMFLTIFIMMPVFEKVNVEAIQPYINEQLAFPDAIETAGRPFHEFMLHQTRESDIDLFMRISASPEVEAPSEIPFFVLAPAFVTSELKTAFQIGFTLFIPFLIIDIVVASVLMAMGMMMLSPIIISLPFKIMLFVLVDGWAMVIGSLAASFGQ